MTSTALGNGRRAGSRAAGRQVPVQEASEGVRSPEDPAVGEIGSPCPGPRLGWDGSFSGLSSGQPEFLLSGLSSGQPNSFSSHLSSCRPLPGPGGRLSGVEADAAPASPAPSSLLCPSSPRGLPSLTPVFSPEKGSRQGGEGRVPCRGGAGAAGRGCAPPPPRFLHLPGAPTHQALSVWQTPCRAYHVRPSFPSPTTPSPRRENGVLPGRERRAPGSRARRAACRSQGTCSELCLLPTHSRGSRRSGGRGELDAEDRGVGDGRLRALPQPHPGRRLSSEPSRGQTHVKTAQRLRV